MLCKFVKFSVGAMNVEKTTVESSSRNSIITAKIPIYFNSLNTAAYGKTIR